MYGIPEHLRRRKKNNQQQPASTNPESAPARQAPIPQTISQAVHLLRQQEEKGGENQVQDMVSQWHQALGNRAVARIMRAATVEQTETEPAEAFRHATSTSAREVPFRGEMEQAFGVSFAGVKSYQGNATSEGLNLLGAEAAAFGNQVAFNSSNPSRETVAHELTHVVQQGGHMGGTTLPTKLDVSDPGDAAEVEAEEVAQNFKH